MGYGGDGIRLDRVEDINSTLKRALELSRGDEGEEARPVLINTLIGKTDFRDGSISV